MYERKLSCQNKRQKILSAATDMFSSRYGVELSREDAAEVMHSLTEYAKVLNDIHETVNAEESEKDKVYV